MGWKNLSSIGLLWLFSLTAIAQNPDTVKSYGNFSAEWRTFYMATINKGELKNFQALATGGYVKYVYHLKSRWEFGGALYTSFNLNIADITATDPTTGQGSRYESGLFNVNDLDDRTVVIPAELFVRYKWNGNRLTAGRTKIKSSFINGQDGRMIPTVVEGLYLEHRSLRDWSFNVGVFNRIAPRSTGRFYQIGQSIGQYPVGRNPDGTPSQYRNNTVGKAIFLAQATWQPHPKFEVDVTEYFVERIFNTVHIRPKYYWSNPEGRSFAIRGEWVRQDRVADGGNADPAKRFFTDKQANVFGLQLSTKHKTGWRLSYNRITAHGRFLFPREWGREFLFGFQKRERSEGSGDAHSVMLAATHAFNFKKARLNSEFSMAHHWRPEVPDAALNKYAFPDYTHVNADFFFIHEKVPNLRPEILITYKFSQDDATENPNAVINKVDMWQLNFVLNYRFN